MQVIERIQEIKNRNSHDSIHKITRLWICPEIVKKPKIGRNYVIETGINNSIPESLHNMEVRKSWTENDCLCIVFKIPGYPENYKSDDFEIPEY